MTFQNQSWAKRAVVADWVDEAAKRQSREAKLAACLGRVSQLARDGRVAEVVRWVRNQAAIARLSDASRLMLPLDVFTIQLASVRDRCRDRCRWHGRLTRFRRESELLATLNHSNIGAMYGFEA